MEERPHSNSTVIWLSVVFVVIVVIVCAGYYIWHNGNVTKGTTATTDVSGTGLPVYQSPPTVAPAAPEVTDVSDLNNAMQTLNQTSISSSNTDSSQLSTQSSGF